MKSPAFQFYPTDYLASQRVQMMTLEEEGAYVRLLCYCWQHGDIPAEPSQAARLIGKGASTTLATTVLAMFNPITGTDRMNHDRLEAERAKQAAWREKSAAGGRKSAQSRKNAATTLEPPLEGCLENGYNQKATFHLQSPSPSPSPPSGSEPRELPKKPFRENKGKSTIDDLRSFALEIGLPASDGESMFHHWEANGWKNGPNPVKDWKAGIRKWKSQGWLPSQKGATTKPSRHAGLNTMEITGNEF